MLFEKIDISRWASLLFYYHSIRWVGPRIRKRTLLCEVGRAPVRIQTYLTIRSHSRIENSLLGIVLYLFLMRTWMGVVFFLLFFKMK